MLSWTEISDRIIKFRPMSARYSQLEILSQTSWQTILSYLEVLETLEVEPVIQHSVSAPRM